MMKRIIMLCLWICPYLGITQSEGFKDIIYLHNGSTLKGRLLKYNVTDTILLAISETEIITLHAKNVKKVKMSGSAMQDVEMYKLKSPAWYIRTQFSFLYARSQGGYSLGLSTGYQVNHWLALGIGSGIDNYYASQGYNIYPMYGEVRVGLYKKNKSPYLGIRTGYGFVPTVGKVGQVKTHGGLFFNPTIGYRLGAGFPYIDVIAGIRFQSAYYETAENQSRSEFVVDFRRYDLGFGITF